MGLAIATTNYQRLLITPTSYHPNTLLCYNLPMLIGHYTAQATLAQLLTSGQFPHAMLLHGPQGIGKRTLAQMLAHRLICGPAIIENALFAEPTSPNPLEANQNTPQWHQLQAASCPDFHVLEPEDDKKTISIKQVKTLLETLARSADTARTVIIDSLDALTPEAANTLLKTLEEPRPGIYFLLLAHQLSSTLPTIRSRCRLLRLSPLTRAETEQVLPHQNAPAAQIAAMALAAQGAPGQVLGQGGKEKTELANQLAQNTTPSFKSAQLIPLLQAKLASHPRPTLAHIQLYQTLTSLQQRQQTLNLPLQMVNEAAWNLAHPHLNPQHP